MKPHLSPSVEAGPFIILSGQLGFDAEGRITGDITEQTLRTLSNITAELAKWQLGLSDVVKATVWLTSAANFGAFNAAYAQAFGEHRPARSTVVSGLALPEALIEIEVMALRASA